MTPDNVYGFAKHEAVESAILSRLEFVIEEDTLELRKVLKEAVLALLEINNTIPVQSRQRHLVAQALEAFADGENA